MKSNCTMVNENCEYQSHRILSYDISFWCKNNNYILFTPVESFVDSPSPVKLLVIFYSNSGTETKPF